MSFSPFSDHSQVDQDQAQSELHSPGTSSSESSAETIGGITPKRSGGNARKRLRRDSDSHPSGKKMSKSSHPSATVNNLDNNNDNDPDTDTEISMEGLMASQSSISESSASASSSRMQNSAEKAESLATTTPRPKLTWQHDETYYFEDGSCVILIDDTLFNVHRSILSKDSSSFSTMFSLPQGSIEVEGRSDDNPIILTGDTPDEFRHFLWALYALPPELRILTSPNANLNHLIDIARVSNKYFFKSLETWALDAIQEYVNRKPSPLLTGMPAIPTASLTSALSSSPFTNHTITSFIPDSTSSASTHKPLTQAETSPLLSSLIRLAQLCQHQPLLLTMIALLRQLMSSSVHYAYLAMTLSDELDLRTLRGAAYLEVMQKAVVVRKVGVDVLRSASASSTGSVSDGSLVQTDGGRTQIQSRSHPGPGEAGTLDSSGRLIITRSQQLRLLAGFYRLTSTWDLLRTTPPPFDHSPSCSATWHQQGCTQSFLEFWKEKTRSEAVMGLGLADVLGRLRTVQKEYERWGSATYMHHDCRMIAKRAIVDVVRRVEEALPDYFAEPGGCESDDEGVVGVV